VDRWRHDIAILVRVRVVAISYPDGVVVGPLEQAHPALGGKVGAFERPMLGPPARLEEPPPAPRHHVGKTTRRERSLKARRERAG
jgi:hypothetical protein